MLVGESSLLKVVQQSEQIVQITSGCRRPGTPETSQVQARTLSANHSTPSPLPTDTGLPWCPLAGWPVKRSPSPPTGSSSWLVFSFKTSLRSQPSVSKTGRFRPLRASFHRCGGFTSSCVRARRSLRQGPRERGDKDGSARAAHLPGSRCIHY